MKIFKQLLFLGLGLMSTIAYAKPADIQAEPGDSADFSIQVCNYLPDPVTFGFRKASAESSTFKIYHDDVVLPNFRCGIISFRVCTVVKDGCVQKDLDIERNFPSIFVSGKVDGTNFKNYYRIRGLFQTWNVFRQKMFKTIHVIQHPNLNKSTANLVWIQSRAEYEGKKPASAFVDQSETPYKYSNYIDGFSPDITICAAKSVTERNRCQPAIKN